MNIQPDYDQVEILLDKLINFKIINYDKLPKIMFIMKKIASKIFLDYQLL